MLSIGGANHKVSYDIMLQVGQRLNEMETCSKSIPSLVPRPFVGETAWQLTRVQTVYGYDVKEITAPPVQAMNIG